MDIKTATYKNAKAKKKEKVELLKTLNFNPSIIAQMNTSSQP